MKFRERKVSNRERGFENEFKFLFVRKEDELRKECCFIEVYSMSLSL